MERENSLSTLLKFPHILYKVFSFYMIAFDKTIIPSFFRQLNFIRKRGLICIALFSISMISWGQVNGDYRSRQDGDWDDNSTWQVYNGGWSNCLAGDYPGATAGAKTVFISDRDNITLNISPAFQIEALTFEAGNTGLSSVDFDSNWTLNVSGAVTYSIPGGISGDQAINVVTGTLNCAAITMVGTGSDSRVLSLLLSTGNINVSGDITIVNATQNDITVSGNGIIYIGGNFTSGNGTFNAGTGTVDYNGAAQDVAALTYYNLTISGSGIKTLQGNSTVGNILTLTSGLLTLGANNLTLETTATISGSPGIGAMVIADGTGKFVKNFQQIPLPVL
jgi:hypothetical protein